MKLLVSCILIPFNISLVMSIMIMMPEPPETNFFLKNLSLESGPQQPVVFFTNSNSTKPELLCLQNSYSKPHSVDLLAHKLCADSNFSTPVDTSLFLPNTASGLSTESSFITSELSCHQDEYFEISCNRSVSSGPCSILQITCGACHKHVSLQPNSSLQLLSPLYPVLQPGLVCQYDLELGHDTAADIAIEITDLSLAQPEQSLTGNKHCLHSFLHLLSGESFKELKSFARLCGEVYFPTGQSYFRVTDPVVRLMLVTGVEGRALGRRGFLVNIYVSPLSRKATMQKLWILLSCVGLLVIIGVIMPAVFIHLNRKSSKARIRKPQRRQTWHGTVARPWGSWDQERVDRISHFGNNNLYMFDNRINRRLPQLPPFHFGTDQDVNNQDEEDPGYKLYETISLQSWKYNSVLDEAVANTEIKLSTRNIQQKDQDPPPLTSRSTSLDECPYSSSLYLTLPGSSTGLRPDQDTVDRCDETVTEQDNPGARHKSGKHRFTGLVDRIRSISMTECSEDETNLINGDN